MHEMSTNEINDDSVTLALLMNPDGNLPFGAPTWSNISARSRNLIVEVKLHFGVNFVFSL